MKLFLSLTALIIVCLTAGTTVHSKEGKTMKTNDKKAVLAVIETMTNAFHAKDIEGIMKNYEPTATIVFEPGAPTSDPTVLREMFQGAFMINPHFTYYGHEVVVAGDSAMHVSPWKMTGTTPDGQTIEQSGLSIAVLRRQADGNWLMVIDNPHGSVLMEK